jgi:1-acyl-sn-glycerol-3-phosphate acyltransferase
VIPARKHRLFNAWFAGHARARIERSFAGVFVRGIEAARRAAEGAPVLIVSNHTSWWDPLVVLHLSQHVLRTDGHALMDAKNLRRLPFFSLVGAFGVDLDRPADGAASIKYAARLLDRPGRMVWVFPQGRERPTSERPLGFRAGSAEIARIAKKATTLPAAFRYELGAEEKPYLYISFGDPVPADRNVDRGRKEQERAVTEELDRIERAIRSDGGAEAGAAGEAAAFERVHRARAPFFGALAERLLARLTRPRGRAGAGSSEGVMRLTPGERPIDPP